MFCNLLFKIIINIFPSQYTQFDHTVLNGCTVCHAINVNKLYKHFLVDEQLEYLPTACYYNVTVKILAHVCPQIYYVFYFYRIDAYMREWCQREYTFLLFKKFCQLLSQKTDPTVLVCALFQQLWYYYMLPTF